MRYWWVNQNQMDRAAVPAIAIALLLAAPLTIVHTQTDDRPTLSVKPTNDFEVAGTGDHAAWQQVQWTALRRRQPDGHPFEARFKMLYSTAGLYFLMDGTDRKLTA